MTRPFFTLLLSVFLSVFLTFTGISQTSFQTNHIFVIDKTGSMIGQPAGSGNQDIWDEVSSAIIRYVDEIPIGDSIKIFTFAEGLSGPKKFLIKSQSDQDQAIEFIRNISVDGRHTCIYNALMNVVIGLNNKSGNYRRRIYLYTDGHNNCSGYTMQEIAQEFSASREDYDYLYYVSLGLDVPEEVKKEAKGPIKISNIPNPKTDSITPKIINIKEDTVVFDLRRQKIDIQSITILTTGKLDVEIRLKGEFICSEKGIELADEILDVSRNQCMFELKSSQDYFKSKIVFGEIICSVVHGKVVLENSKLITKILLPTKRKIKVDY